MKRIILFILMTLPFDISSCESIQVDTDASPVTIEIYVKDADGNNLLEQNWLLGKNVTATFKGETYDLQTEETRAYMPHFYGFKVTARDLGMYLYFGELAGTEALNDDFVINWGDGSSDVITIYNDCKAKMNGAYDIKRHFVVNGVKTEDNRITLVKEAVLPPSEPKFPTLEIKDASLNTYTANIFEPVHFYLEGDSYMNWSLSQLCDSLVFSVMGEDETRKVYYDEKGHSELIVGWDHYFYLPKSCICRIQGYKDNKVIYTDAIEVNLTNEKDFLMYDWDDISDATIGSVAYNNFIVPELTLLSQSFWKDEIPYVRVYLDKSLNTPYAKGWLYDYITRLYKAPAYTDSAEVEEKYAELFVSADKNDTPLHIWQDDMSVIALVRYDYSDIDGYIGSYVTYLKAEQKRIRVSSYRHSTDIEENDIEDI